MPTLIKELFTNQTHINKIQKLLAKLYQLAEIDNQRNGKLGMEIGSARERILIALMMSCFGEDKVNTDIPITQSEIDVILDGLPISIKTVTGNNINSLKLIWTVDRQKVLEFQQNYNPQCDILLSQIVWGGCGNLYLFPLSTQKEVLDSLGKDVYIKLPREGTNPRGAELSKQAITALIKHNETLKLNINFEKRNIKYDQYKRWLDLWNDN